MSTEPGRYPARRQPAWLLPAAIAGLALLAVIAGILLAIVLGRDSGEGTGLVSASPTANGSVSSSEASASASVEPTPEPNPILPNRAIAEVTSGSADIHREPDDASPVRWTLETGRRMFVIGEPQAVGDQRWYRIGIVSVDACGDVCAGIGWVATPVSGESSVQEVDVECPESPMTDDELGQLDRLERLHCYGRTEIVVTGVVNTPCCGYVGAYRFKPAWLAFPSAPAFLGGGRGLDFRHHPDVNLEVPERGDVVRVTGHFEDPAAPTCRQTIDPAYAHEDVDPPDQAMAVLTCRSAFVWTAYEVIGHEDLGPCCGSRGHLPVRIRLELPEPMLATRSRP